MAPKLAPAGSAAQRSRTTSGCSFVFTLPLPISTSAGLGLPSTSNTNRRRRALIARPRRLQREVNRLEPSAALGEPASLQGAAPAGGVRDRGFAGRDDGGLLANRQRVESDMWSRRRESLHHDLVGS